MSAVITSVNQVPVIVERAMYLSLGAQQFGAGHESAAVEAPSLQWFFGEGATGPYFDLFFLIANPHAQAATVEGRYLLSDGTVITKTYTVAPNSRFNVWVDFEAPELANTAHGRDVPGHQWRAGDRRARDVVAGRGGHLAGRPQQLRRHRDGREMGPGGRRSRWADRDRDLHPAGQHVQHRRSWRA